ncbi:follistatin-related protein 5 isoform X1, partial [Tachysurus ichikawai]
MNPDGFDTYDNCRLVDYKKLNSKVLNLHALRFLPSGAQDSYVKDMASRKHVVDMMFKRFDADGNGQVDSSELSQ